MKKLFTFFAFMLSAGMLLAQVTTPAPSPLCKMEQKVGLTDVTLEYSRPGIKDRTIFGGLVPYNEMWRTGANSSSKVGFSTDVKIGDQTLPAGKYTLFTIPGEDKWTIIFHTNLNYGGVPNDYDKDGEALRFDVKSQTMTSTVENFIIVVDNMTNQSAEMILAWENTSVAFDFWVPTDEAVVASIEKAMAGPSAGDYYSAAAYYHDEGKDLKQSLAWIDMAIEKGGERFWVLRKKALIQADMKDYKGAIVTAKKSIESAKEAGNKTYVMMNEESIAKWMKM